MDKHKRILTIVEGRDANQHMAKQLVDTAEKMGWGTRLIKSVSMIDIAENKLDDLFSHYVLWRGLINNTVYDMARMIDFVNQSGRVAINTNVAGGISCTSNKYFQHGAMSNDPVLREHILPMYQANNLSCILKLIEIGKIDYPFCLKPNFGTRGEGIYLIRKREDLTDNINYSVMSIEPYVKSEFDWRVFVLGGKALGVMRKIGNTHNEADFMAKSGGRQRFNEDNKELADEMCDLAVASGLDYTGVDLIRDDKTGKIYVLETNFAGGWQNGFKEATGVDVPEKIIEYFEERYQEENK